MSEARPRIQSVAVFCGSRPGHDPAMMEGARELGRGLAARGMTLVYGGGNIGLMGAIADAVLGAGGTVFGVIPEFLTRREVAHRGVAEMVVTDSMHSRKRLMFDRADAFVVMPGGLGTLDETFEIVTWRQLELHDKPIFICDVNGWATSLLAAFEASIRDGFADEASRRLFEVVSDVPALLARLGEPRDAGGGESDRL